MKRFLLYYSCALSFLLFFSGLQAQPGTPDSSFGINGKMLTSFGANYSPCYSIVQQTDGKFITAGSSVTFNDNGFITSNFAIARNRSDGRIDSSFGLNGRIVTPFENGDNEIHAVGLQSSGKIVVTGPASTVVGVQGILTRRYTADGRIDSTFGINGVHFLSGHADNAGNALIVLRDDKILIAGHVYQQSQDFVLIRLLASGKPDSSFGINGIVTTDFSGRDDQAQAMVLQADNKIILAGHSGWPRSFCAVRYNYNGGIDKSYGSNGKALFQVGTEDIGTSAAVQKDSKLLIGGTTWLNNLPYHVVLRLDSRGKPDSTFGINGKVTSYANNIESFSSAVAVQADDKVLLAGTNNTHHTLNDFIIMRYTATGKTDATFGTNGSTYTDFGADDIVHGMLLQQDGSIVVAGRGASPAYGEGFAIARYKGEQTITVSLVRDIIIAEGAAGTTTPVKFKVSLNKPAAEDVFIHYTTRDLTASSGSDYVAGAGSLKIKAGERSANIVITILGDNISEPNERFALVISDPLAAVTGLIDSVSCSIKNDDILSVATEAEQDIVGKNVSVKVYPNPVRDVLYVVAPGTNKFTLTSPSGAVLLTQQIVENGTINTAILAAGIYFLKNQVTGEVKRILLVK